LQVHSVTSILYLVYLKLNKVEINSPANFKTK
jgi:hypothetical protein